MLVLVDGHNLIGQLSDISLDEANDEDRLVIKLRRYRARTGRKIIVFFDSGGGYKISSKQSRGGISERYAPNNKTADDLIISYLQKVKQPQQFMVVTSDRAIQRIAKQVGSRVVSSADFAVELKPLRTSPEDETDVQLSDEEVADWLSLFGQDE